MAVPAVLEHDLAPRLEASEDHELLLVRRGPRTGVQMIVAVH